MAYDPPFPNTTPSYGAGIGGTPRHDTSAVAGVGRRLVAGLIDAGILVVALFVLLVLVGVFLGFFGFDDSATQSGVWIAFGLWVAFGWLYSALLEGSSAQATVGKLALRLQVVDTSGRRLSFARATLRFWTKTIFTLLTLSIAFFVAAFTERHQALYDLIAGTIVIPRGAQVLGPAEVPLGRAADPAAVEMLRARAASPTEVKSPMSGKRWDRALAALAQVAEPGERPIAAASTMVGPSPFVVALLLGWMGRLFLLKSALLWITDSRIILIRLSNWNNRPKGVIFAEPRSNISLFRAESRTLWLRRTDGTEYRLNNVKKAQAAWISQALGGPLTS
jgi:uncharacterized RDD family membrane protein YckC